MVKLHPWANMESAQVDEAPLVEPLPLDARVKGQEREVASGGMLFSVWVELRLVGKLAHQVGHENCHGIRQHCLG